MPPFTPCSGTGYDTVEVSEVEGHADQVVVADGSQTELIGKDRADSAAIYGGFDNMMELSVPSVPSFARDHWHPIMVDLQKFMVAVSLVEVHYDGIGGTAFDAKISDKGGIFKTCSSTLRITVDHVSLPGPLGFLNSSWCGLSSLPITHEDVAVWPVSVNILLELLPSWPLFIGLKERDG